MAFCLRWTVAAILLCGQSAPPDIHYRDDFETPRVAWVQGTADAPFTVQQHDRTDERAHRGLRCERIVLLSGRGTQILYHYPKLPRIAVTEGGFVRIWIKSNRQGPQLLLRVTLPHEPPGAADESARLVVIPGPVYERAGKWQLLEVADTKQALDRQLRLVRAHLGRDVDARDAYIDSLTLNLYAGQGLVEVYIDDLEASPRVADDSTAEIRLGGVQTPRAVRFEVAGEQIRFQGVPRLPKLAFVRGSGGPFPSLGVDGVMLVDPDPVQLAGRGSGPWLLPLLRLPEPGPDAVVEANLRASVRTLKDTPSLVAWGVPAIAPPWRAQRQPKPQQRAEAVEHLRRAVQYLHAEDPDRPVLLAGNQSLYEVSRFGELLLAGRNPIGTSFPMGDYAEWLEARRMIARPGLPLLGWVPTRPAPMWMPGAATYEQIRLAAYACLAAGCRGVVYDLSDVSEDQRQWIARRVELVNAELSLLEPFIAAAGPPERLKAESIRVAGAGERELEAERERLRSSLAAGRSLARSELELGDEFDTAVYRTPRAVLVLLAWTGAGAEAVPAQLACRELRFVVEGVPETALAWQMNAAGAEPLPRRRVAGGMEVTVREFDTACAIVLSTDPRIFHMARARADALRRVGCERMIEIAQERLQRCQRVLTMMSGRSQSADVVALLARAEAAARIAQQHQSRGALSEAFRAASRALRAVRLAERTVWQELRPPGYRPGSNPLLQSFTLLPRQQELMQALRAAGTYNSANLLPEGAFEDKDALASRGWTQRVDLPRGLSARAYLVDGQAARSGRVLRLLVEPQGSEGPPVVVFDGETGFTLYTGQITAPDAGVLVVSVLVKLPRPLRPALAEFVIYDTLYGEECAVRVRPSTRGWQRVVLYRPVGRNARLKLAFGLRGVGEVLLDELSVRFVPLQVPQLATGTTEPAQTR